MSTVSNAHTYEYDLFLAHAGKATATAEELYDRLHGREGARVFLDKASLTEGGSWPDELDHALRASRIAVVLFTPAVASAFYVTEEIQRAIALMRTYGSPLIVPIYLQGTEPGRDAPYGLFNVQSISAPGDDLDVIASRLLDIHKRVRSAGDEHRDRATDVEPETPRELVVDPRGGDDAYSTVRRALANAGPDDIIRIRPGLYDETLTITQPVRLVGDGPAHAVILQSFNATTITLTAPGGSISGITVRQQGGTFPYQAIDISAGMATIEGCVIVGGTRSAVRARGTSTPTIERNIISGTSGLGIELGDFASPIVADNWIRDLAETGIWVGGRAHPVIERNLIERCVATGVWAGHDARLRLTSNAIDGCGNGVVVVDKAFATVTGNRIVRSRRSALRFMDDADGVASGNVLRSSGCVQIHVDTTGSPAFDGNTVAGGRADGVLVTGVPSGEPATFTRNTIVENRWSGVFVRSNGRAKFRDNLLARNRDNGLTIHDGAAGDYESNIVTGNGQNGISLHGAGEPDVTMNRVADNGWSGIYVSASAPRCDRNLVLANPWGAITIADGAAPRLKENDLSAKDNAAILVHDAGGADIYLNHVHTSAVGIDVRRGRLRIVDNTIDSNEVGVRVAAGTHVEYDQNSLGANKTAIEDVSETLPASASAGVVTALTCAHEDRRSPLFVRRLDALEPGGWGAADAALTAAGVPGAREDDD